MLVSILEVSVIHRQRCMIFSLCVPRNITLHYRASKAEYVTSCVARQLYLDTINNPNMHTGLKIFSKPKGVWTAQEFKPYELKLLPSTRSIIMKDASKKISEGLVSLGMRITSNDGKQMSWYLASSNTLPKGDGTGSEDKCFVSAFFMVSRTEDPTEANMEIVNQGELKNMDSADMKKFEVVVPFMRNTCKLEPKQQLFILSESAKLAKPGRGKKRSAKDVGLVK